ncbi:MAG: Smr/MutS family protein [Candidatus Binatia bacterium]|nr:Smr/MutS family protein [Candidatus Binatia bacterium]
MHGLLRRLFGIVPTLDLHGFGVRPALDATKKFLEEAHARGEPEVRIIYGKGKGSPGGIGVLRQAVPAWIEQNAREQVDHFERQLDRSGDDGAMIVFLRAR